MEPNINLWVRAQCYPLHCTVPLKFKTGGGTKLRLQLALLDHVNYNEITESLQLAWFNRLKFFFHFRCLSTGLIKSLLCDKAKLWNLLFLPWKLLSQQKNKQTKEQINTACHPRMHTGAATACIPMTCKHLQSLTYHIVLSDDSIFKITDVTHHFLGTNQMYPKNILALRDIY